MHLKIIKIGDLLIEASEEPDISIFVKKLKYGGTGASTVTLIKGEKTLLVDTGFEGEAGQDSEERNHEKLKMLLQCEGITPQDVDYVFFTHLHKDHTGNYALFKRAQFLMSAYEYERCPIRRSEPVRDNDEIMGNVFALYTPGHTEGHCSLRVVLEDTIVIAGDALVSLTYLLKGKFWCYNPDYYSDRASRESLKKIIGSADYIIPGHGSIFRKIA